jgi:Mg2+-importing ATPase
MATVPGCDPSVVHAQDEAALLSALGTSADGLDSDRAAARLREGGANRIETRRNRVAWRLLLGQFKSPLLLILVFAAVISMLTRAWVDATIVLTIILASGLLGFIQEYSAGRAIERLLSRIRPRANVLRHGQPVSVDAETLVAGDVVRLAAGSLVPADGRVLTAHDFFVNEAVLTGESLPVEKHPATLPAGTALVGRINCVYQGTNVRSGTARVLITATARDTVFGQIAARLASRVPETEFERGLRRFGQMLTQLMTLLVLAIFAINVAYDRPVTESLLFAVALAVGLAPELLPAIVSLTLARGAQSMARAGVIVRRLVAIENFGAMNVLATDKTGTLTLGVVQLDKAVDAAGNLSASVRALAGRNARLQTGLPNPLDEALIAATALEVDSTWTKVEEIPYDFVRKRLSVAVRPLETPDARSVQLITKGALDPLLAICSSVRDGALQPALDAHWRDRITKQADQWGDEGFRVLGVATRMLPACPRYSAADERELTFEGFLLFFDPPKPEARQAIEDLNRLGVQLKIITGDSRRVAQHVAAAVGLNTTGLLTGSQLQQVHDDALPALTQRITLFAEVDPGQKERIIRALRGAGHVVGYLGDGINDAPALHAADVGISVDSAVDVARESADLVLLEHSLAVLQRGIEEGRRVFANTLKYIYTTTSANFGNMLSMAALSLFLPFLPLLPKQILLNNFLSDVPSMALATDSVDRDLIAEPRRWDIARVRRFMLHFGLLSSLFDAITFIALLWLLHVSPAEFRTAWFVESLLTELAIVLVVRTRLPLLRSRPGNVLLAATVLMALAAVLVPYVSPLAALFEFVPLSATTMGVMLAITMAYVLANEWAKRTLGRQALF